MRSSVSEARSDGLVTSRVPVVNKSASEWAVWRFIMISISMVELLFFLIRRLCGEPAIHHGV